MRLWWEGEEREKLLDDADRTRLPPFMYQTGTRFRGGDHDSPAFIDISPSLVARPRRRLAFLKQSQKGDFADPLPKLRRITSHTRLQSPNRKRRPSFKSFPRLLTPDLPPCFGQSDFGPAGLSPRLIVSRVGRIASWLRQTRRHSSNQPALPTLE